MEQNDRPPVWKQVLGAVVGGSLALAIYAGYKATPPNLQAYLSLPMKKLEEYGGQYVRLANRELAEDESSRLAAKAEEVARRFSVDGHQEEEKQYDTELPSYIEEMSGILPDTKKEEESLLAHEHMEDVNDAWAVREQEHHEWESEWQADVPKVAEPLPPPPEPEYVASVTAVAEAPALPSSGVETWIMAAVALAGAGLIWRKKLAQLWA